MLATLMTALFFVVRAVGQVSLGGPGRRWDLTLSTCFLESCGFSYCRRRGAVGNWAAGAAAPAPAELWLCREALRAAAPPLPFCPLTCCKSFPRAARDQPVPRRAPAVPRVPAPALADSVCDPEPPEQPGQRGEGWRGRGQCPARVKPRRLLGEKAGARARAFSLSLERRKTG